jgi:hypothetical protein
VLDPVVLLTPLLVLVIALLLGFAGCGFTGSGAGQLSGVARVPTELTVTRIQFDWTDPTNAVGNFWEVDPQRSDTEDGIDVFSYVLQTAAIGGWTVRCQVTVRDSTGATSASEDECTFRLEDLAYHKANFEASGTPSDLNFAVTCTGLT